jgi:isocitrate dehydrogenase
LKTAVRALEAARKELEAARVADPVQAMIASGRMPTTVGGIMSPVVVVRNEDMVNVAMHQMIDKGVNAVMVEPDASGQLGRNDRPRRAEEGHQPQPLAGTGQGR